MYETQRLQIREFALSDTEFIVELLNDPSFIRYIADKQVRTSEDAEQYLRNGPILSYQTYGFGLKLVCLKATQEAIGMCGILKRAELDSPDLGYAFLPRYWKQGYALEAATAVMEHETKQHSLACVQAVTLPDNLASNQLLHRLGFTMMETISLYGQENNLYQHA
ncbi:N-acetyltransferase [Vibrio sinensis]|uniref:N-acetyltransferase n=1 Tax=Vibrio sinensis TaxID=2302434 RepID=A0A3A6QGD0_9VIBR|nr:GNAT family N-acetyltransferase [Vibrio sinensis]RJX69522.1 N-acetyltransferase [Vibrio sinensis]